MRSAALLLALALLAAGCGQRGPLYYRDNPPPGVRPAKPEPYKPTPYPKDRDAGDEDAAGQK